MHYEPISTDFCYNDSKTEFRIILRDLTQERPTAVLVDAIYDYNDTLKHLYINFEVDGLWYMRPLKFDYEYQRETVELLRKIKYSLYLYLVTDIPESLENVKRNVTKNLEESLKQMQSMCAGKLPKKSWKDFKAELEEKDNLK
jgi:hypothetical protein